MIKRIKVTNPFGETVEMELRSPEQSGFYISQIDGLGPSRGEVVLANSPNFDGGFFNSSRVGSKNIVLHLSFSNSNSYQIETLRKSLYRYFPIGKKVTFEILTDTDDVSIDEYVETNEPDIFSISESTIISIICPDAMFSVKEQTVVDFGGTSGLFSFPFSNESLVTPLIEFGNITLDMYKTTYYTGDVESGITIEMFMNGAVTDPSIINISTNQTMTLSSTKITSITGSNFVYGDRVIISTVKGSKSASLIRSGVTYNILNALSFSVDWIYLTLLDNGQNTLTYSAVSGIDNIHLLIGYSPLVSGV